MNSRWSDLDRPPLDAAALTRALRHGGTGLWGPVEVVRVTGSTNADLAAAARAGAPEGSVLVAEAQQAGRGRLDRVWSSPPRAGLTVSLLLRPVGVPADRWGLLPLLVGAAVAEAVRDRTGIAASVKWPNDVVVEPPRADGAPGPRKLAGVLCEAAGGGVVVGLGLNVSTREDELPTAGVAATSLALEAGVVTDGDGEPVDRATVLLAVLRHLEQGYRPWCSAGGDPGRLLAAYRPLSSTLGRRVSVLLPGEQVLTGDALDIEPDGRLRVRDDQGTDHVVGTGDVVHLRAV